MRVTTERLPDSQMVLEIEVEPERLERSLDKGYRKLVKSTHVPGFRRGKAPRPMLERHVGRYTLLREALEILVPEVYDQALEEEGIQPIGAPSIELIQEDPPVIKATVPLQPSVELGDYHNIRLERSTVEATAAEIDEALEELRRLYAVQEPVDRPVQMGDVVRADIRAVVEGKEIFADKDVELRLTEGSVLLLPGFVEGLVGAEKDVRTEVESTIPEGSDGERRSSLSGQKCRISATVKDIKREDLPDLDDEFARNAGEGFSSLEELRRRKEKDIVEGKQPAADEEYRREAVALLVSTAREISFPPVLVEREVDRQLREEARMVGADVPQYLKRTRQTEEERHQEIRPQAEERVRRSLVLSRLAELEGIEVTDADVDDEVKRVVASGGAQSEQLEQLFSSSNGREAVEHSLLTRKTLERLVEIASSGDAAIVDRQPIETTGGQ